jgi:IstB-like ATP binding protein
MDKRAVDFPPADPHLVGSLGSGCGLRWMKVEAPMRPGAVVWSRHSLRAVPTQRSAKAFAFRAWIGHAAVEQGFRVRYTTAVELVETLCLGLADNSVGKVIDGLLRFDLVFVDKVGFAPLMRWGPSCCSGSWPGL